MLWWTVVLVPFSVFILNLGTSVSSILLGLLSQLTTWMASTLERSQGGPIDFSRVTKLKEVTLQLGNPDDILTTMALKTLASEHRDL